MNNRSSAYFSFDIVDIAVAITANVNTDVMKRYRESSVWFSLDGVGSSELQRAGFIRGH